MLQISYVRENRDEVIAGLQKKNFKELHLIDEVIALDESRRSLQSSSESIAAEANASAKQIGDLMRQGKREEADAIKLTTSSHKAKLKDLWR